MPTNKEPSWNDIRKLIKEGDAKYLAAAQAIKTKMDANPALTQRDVAKEIGKSVGWINSHLKWLKDGATAQSPFAEGHAKQKQKQNLVQHAEQTTNELYSSDDDNEVKPLGRPDPRDKSTWRITPRGGIDDGKNCNHVPTLPEAREPDERKDFFWLRGTEWWCDQIKRETPERIEAIPENTPPQFVEQGLQAMQSAADALQEAIDKRRQQQTSRRTQNDQKVLHKPVERGISTN